MNNKVIGFLIPGTIGFITGLLFGGTNPPNFLGAVVCAALSIASVQFIINIDDLMK